MLAFPLYLFVRTPGKKGSHFDPNSDVFLPNEKKDVLTSTASWLAMIGVLAVLTFAMGPLKMLKLYAIPYAVSRVPHSFYHIFTCAISAN
jgi:omega-3 fatty acid desaturase (delta-15 desaturase)